MAVIDTLRPIGTYTAGTWTAVPSGTLHGVTSDDSDSTYALGPVASGQMSLQVTSHTPPADHERHGLRARVRARSDGSTTRILSGGGRWPNGAAYTVSLSSTIQSYTNPWRTTLNSLTPLPGAGTVSDFYYSGNWSNDDAARIYEAYIDIDCRHFPYFTADVLDADGDSISGGTATVSDQVTLRFGSVDYDDLPARTWYVEVRDSSSNVVFQDSGSGAAPASVLANLPNDTYTATFIVGSTIRTNDAFYAPDQVITFDVLYIPPTVTPFEVTVTSTGGVVNLCWIKHPFVGVDFDPGSLVVDIRRTMECTGVTEDRATLVGDEWYEACWEDRFLPFSRTGVYCGEDDHVCCLTYEVRYRGTYSGVPITGEWIEGYGPTYQFFDNFSGSGLDPALWNSDGSITVGSGGLTMDVQTPGSSVWGANPTDGRDMAHASFSNVVFPDLSGPIPGRVAAGLWASPTEYAVMYLDEQSGGVGVRIQDPSMGVNIDFPGLAPLDPDCEGWEVTYAGGWLIFSEIDGSGDWLSDVLQYAISPSWMDRVVPYLSAGSATTAKSWDIESVFWFTQSLDADCPKSINPTPGNGWLSGVYSGDMSVCEKKSWTRARPQALYTPALGGKPTVTTGRSAGRDFNLEIATTTLDDLHLLESILAQPYVYYRPADLPAQWCAPETESVQVVQVGRVRVVSVTLRAVEAPPL